MFDIIRAGGWLMLPIIACSVLAFTITLERLWVLRLKKAAPNELLHDIWGWIDRKKCTQTRIDQLKAQCPLGYVLASGIEYAQYGRDRMKEALEDAANGMMHDMERYLTALGTIAAIAPLLGLLGTVVGMIDVFNIIMVQGSGHADLLAGGIAKALITTAAGLTVAIPALVFHRFFVRRVNEIVVIMEQESTKLIELVLSESCEHGAAVTS